MRGHQSAKDETLEKKTDCRTFLASIVHFQADELPEIERRALRDHVDACTGCARRLEFEEGFLRALQQRLGRVSASPGLETRVRASLEQASPAPAAWFRTPWFAAVAASLLLAALIFPWPDRADVVSTGEVEAVAIAAREVLVVDRACDGAQRNLPQQRNCKRRNHTNALQVSDGSYWSFTLERETHRRLLIDPEMRGHRLVVYGNYYPAIRTLDIAQFEDLGREPL